MKLQLLIFSFFILSSYANQKPNILFIFSDDHATQAISAYGSKLNKTPNIDRIANEGMRFDRCYVTNAICGPSRATILTGKYSHLNGFYKNDMNFDGSQPTFPKLLQTAGYETAVIGKWHLHSTPTGFNHYDIITGYGGQGKYFYPVMNRNGKTRTHNGYTSDVITNKTIQWLSKDRNPKKPFMLMVQHKAPHRSWQPAPYHLDKLKDQKFPEPANLHDEYKGRSSATKSQDMMISKSMNRVDLKLVPPTYFKPEEMNTWHQAYDAENQAFEEAKLTGKALTSWNYQRYIREYLRCIISIDDSIGKLLDHLKESGLDKNTIVIYSSDQGFFLGEHGFFDKRFMYEEALRAPLVIKWPGIIKTGTSNSDIVSNLDFAETFLDIAGIKVPNDMQGKSLLPLLKGESPADWRQSFYYHYYGFPDWHLVQKHCGITDKRYKLIHFYTSDEWELYDRQNDPQEMKNLAYDPEHAPLLEKMKKELAQQQQNYHVPADAIVEKNFKQLELENSYLKWGQIEKEK